VRKEGEEETSTLIKAVAWRVGAGKMKRVARDSSSEWWKKFGREKKTETR